MEEADRACHKKEISATDLAIKPGLPRPGTLDHTGRVSNDRTEDAQLSPSRDYSGGYHAAYYSGILSRPQAGGWADRRRVLISVRDVVQQVERGLDAELLEPLGTTRPYSLQVLHGLQQW
jgi:hypothetical protein